MADLVNRKTYDKTYFALAKYVYKQNCGICRSENRQVIEESSLHLEKGTVWCALWAEVLIQSNMCNKVFENYLTAYNTLHGLLKPRNG